MNARDERWNGERTRRDARMGRDGEWITTSDRTREVLRDVRYGEAGSVSSLLGVQAMRAEDGPSLSVGDELRGGEEL